MEESQLYDAQTPGHIFAYRAFRSLFVRSPDSSPAKPSDETNKENIPLPARSPVKRSHDEIASMSSATPKRQRTSIVSPAKSILRNPAEPTPRSARLRDMNVTFKDVRKSISPEVSRKGPVLREQRSSEESSQVRNSGKVTAAKSSTQMKTSDPDCQLRELLLNKSDIPTVRRPRDVPPDLDDYIRNTESEMKKLLKYGQKMRDCARKQNEENTRLRKLLQEAREENDRLKRIVAFTHDEAYVLSEDKDVERVGTNEIIKHSEPRSSQHKLRASTTIRSASKTATPGEGSAPKELSTARSSAAEAAQSQNRLKHQAVQDGEKAKHQLVTNSHLKRKQASPLTKDSPTSNTNVEAEFAMPIRSAGNRFVSTSSKMPSDRVTAARERLRRRTELRRASANVNVGSGVEESQVEWAGL